MHDAGLDFNLQEWFDFKIPRTTVSPLFIEYAILSQEEKKEAPSAKVIWLGNAPVLSFYEKQKKGQSKPMARLIFHNKKEDLEIRLEAAPGKWLAMILERLIPGAGPVLTLQEVKLSYEQEKPGAFEAFTKSSAWRQLRSRGLISV